MKRLLAVCLFLSVLLPLAAQEQDGPIVAVLDFTTDGVSRSEMKTIINLLSSALFQTGSFTVIDVSERERLLQELEFSMEECTEESCLLEVGRMLSAERVVVGNIGKVGSRYVLSTKMLETETARTRNTADGIYPSLDALVDDLFALAEKLARPPGPGQPVARQPALKAAARAAVVPPPGNYWVLGLQAGAAWPVRDPADELGIGKPVLLRTGFVRVRDWGVLSFEALAGFNYRAIWVPHGSGVYWSTVPVGLGMRYSTGWASRWFLTAGATAGVTVAPFLRAFAAPSLGIGWRLSARLGLLLDTYVWMSMAHSAEMIGVQVAPTLGVVLSLGNRKARAAAGAQQ